MNSQPRIVIAGGSGFIGRRLSAQLAAEGFEIVILTRSAPKPAIGPVRFVHWLGGEEPAGKSVEWMSELEDATAVINLCGESVGGPRWSDARKQLLIDSRVMSTRALIEAVNQCTKPPSVFLQASGVGFYGPGNNSVDESSAKGGDFLAQLAAQWEAPMADLRDDVRPLICRLGVVLGNNGGALGQMLLPFRAFIGGPIASGNQWLSWIHLHDAVNAMVHLITSSTASGVFNLTAPEPVRNGTFTTAAGVALRRPTWMITPRFVLKLLLGEQATLVCDGQCAIPAKLRKDKFAFQYPTIDEALADLVDV